MKKSLLALAVAGAFSGAAFAQSSVTIYGRVDVGISKENNGATPLSGGVNTSDKLQVRQLSGSRLGFQGTEDLGGGLKAIFQIEHRFDPDTGNVSAAAFWNGRSYVGLGGPFGTVKLGREYTPAFWVGLFSDPSGFDTVAQMGTATLPGGVVRFANVINYKTPTFGGAAIEVAYVPKETTGVNDKDGFGASVTWAGGPLWIGLGYERPKYTAPVKTDFFTLGGNVKFGPAKVYFNFADGQTDTGNPATSTDRRHLGLGLGYTVGAGELRAMGSRFTQEIASVETKVTKLGVGYHHNLSRRTTLYVDYGRAKQSNPDLTARAGFDAGIKHNF